MELLLKAVSPQVLPIIQEIDEKYGADFIWCSILHGLLIGSLLITVSHESGHTKISINCAKRPYVCVVHELDMPIAVEALNSYTFLDCNGLCWMLDGGGWVVCEERPEIHWVVDDKSATIDNVLYTFDEAVSEVTWCHILLADGRLYERESTGSTLLDFEAFKTEPARKQPNC